MKAFTPSAVLFIGLAVGIFLASLSISPWLLLIALAVAIVLYYTGVRSGALLLLAACAGCALAVSRRPMEMPSAGLEHHARIHAEVLGCSESASGRDLTLRILGVTPDSMPTVALEPFICFGAYPSAVPALEIGDTVAFKGYLLPIPDFRDGRMTTDSYFKARKSGCVAEADIDWESLIVTGKTSGSISLTINRLRHNALMLLCGSGLSEKSSALLSAILLGDTSQLDSEVRDSYSGAGLAHVLAISGLHISVIIGMLSWILYLLPFSARSIIPSLFLLGACWAYTLFLGIPVPVTRAAVMVSVLLLSGITRREYKPMHALFLAGDIILVASPDALFDTGFLLSFCSVAGIMLFAGKLIPFDPATHPRLWKLSFAVSVPLSATLATLPVAASVFGMLPTYFILGNIIVVWMMPLILAGGCIFLLLAAVDLPTGLLADLLNALCGFTQGAASWISSLPGSIIVLCRPGIASLLLYIVFLCLLYAALSLHRKTLAMGSVTALCLAAVTCLPSAGAPAQAYAHRTRFGASIVLENPPHAIVMISDPLDSDTSCVRTLSSYWRSRGVSEISFARQRVCYKGKSFRVAASTISGIETKADYVLIDRHFRGTILDLKNSMDPDTILLSTNLHTARARRYAAECREYGVPVVDLHARPWSLQ